MFAQEANGQFLVEVGGDFHCGPDHESPKLLTWDVEITWPDVALDGRGFLLDNMGFRAYFNAIHYTTESCELLVLKAAKHFRALADKAIKVEVSITVPGLATITNVQE